MKIKKNTLSEDNKEELESIKFEIQQLVNRLDSIQESSRSKPYERICYHLKMADNYIYALIIIN